VGKYFNCSRIKHIIWQQKLSAELDDNLPTSKTLTVANGINTNTKSNHADVKYNTSLKTKTMN